MKTNGLLPLALGVFLLTLPCLTGFAAPLLDTSFETSIGLTSGGLDDQNIAPQIRLPTGNPTGTISDSILVSSLDLRHIDVGIDFLVQETTVGPTNAVYGVGLMLRFKNP
jgi:hypothetical protein